MVGPKKLPHSCLKWANLKVTSQCQKEGGVGSRPLMDNVQKVDAFFLMSFLISDTALHFLGGKYS